ncbi:MAG: nucleoside hydrolase [Proteobacteria bacterium]|nr:MAG: nucleoside hydrolase [Pseudomonadota bacterium]
MPKKIIIDTDPGIDDAMAIFFAITSPELELLGLTTTFGNVSVDTATANALRLVEMSGQDIPVAQGAAQPWVQSLTDYPDFIHGHDGLGNVNLPPPAGTAIELSAAQFIVKTVLENPHEVTLIAIGPLVNLALALTLEPRIAQLVEKVVIMGGTILEPGNVSPVAEANIYCDPHAADKVFRADWHVNMVGLDVTHKILMTDSLQERIRDQNPMCGQFLYKAGMFYADFYRKHRGADGCYVHDASAVAYTINPDLFAVIEGPVRVATEGIARGQTILQRTNYTFPEAHWENITPSSVCMGVDSDAVTALYEKAMARM